MAVFAELLGPTLLSKNGEVDTALALSGKTVGLYFSAHWCPPCRGFTPQLAKSYTSALKAKGLEIVFVSGDQDESAFCSYHGEMPWLALPFASRDKAAALNSQFHVNGIPSLILLGSDGTKITDEGTKMVGMDPSGEGFPWAGAGTSGVPRGMTMKFAEKKAKPFEVIGPILEKGILVSSIPGLLEFVFGLKFAMSSCRTSTLVIWLIVDGLLNLAAGGITYYVMKRKIDAEGSTELQAYLIHKDRDGTVDQDMEDRIEAANKQHTGLASITYFSLFLGIYCYRNTSGAGCDEMPSHAVFYLLVLRFFMPCVTCVLGCCSLPAIMAGMSK